MTRSGTKAISTSPVESAPAESVNEAGNESSRLRTCWISQFAIPAMRPATSSAPKIRHHEPWTSRLERRIEVMAP